MNLQVRRAFTLIELLVALTIIVLLTIISVPVIAPTLRTTRVDAAANMIKGSLMHARNSAIARRESGFCWLAPGMVMESGAVTPVSDTARTLDLTSSKAIIIDNTSAYFSTSGTSPWSVNTTSQQYASDHRRAQCVVGAATAVAKWEFTIPTPLGMDGATGQLTVEGWWPYVAEGGDPATVLGNYQAPFTVYYEAAGGGTASASCQINQVSLNNSWANLSGTAGATFLFKCGGTYRVELNNILNTTPPTRYWSIADAVRVSGTISTVAMYPTRQFKAVGKSWTVSQWKNTTQPYYVTVANKKSGYEELVGRIYDNTADVITIETADEWKDAQSKGVLVAGSPFLICRDDPRTISNAILSLGSGTNTVCRWDSLPEEVTVGTVDAENSSRKVWPVAFTKNGRADISVEYITIKVCDRGEPDNKEAWRFVRIYRNTGRAVVKKSLSEF